jgi:uncharacterized lipoprotein NlpE involved in copper resistance
MKQTLLALLLAFTLMGADNKTNATGTWRINAEKSDFGGMPSPDTLLWVVNDSTDKIVIEEHGGDGSVLTLTFLKGGKEAINRFGSREMKTKLTEEDGAIKEDTVITSSDGDTMTRTSLTRISADGKVLTQVSAIKGPQGVMKRTLVFDKK